MQSIFWRLNLWRRSLWNFASLLWREPWAASMESPDLDEEAREQMRALDEEYAQRKAAILAANQQRADAAAQVAATAAAVAAGDDDGS